MRLERAAVRVGRQQLRPPHDLQLPEVGDGAVEHLRRHGRRQHPGRRHGRRARGGCAPPSPRHEARGAGRAQHRRDGDERRHQRRVVEDDRVLRQARGHEVLEQHRQRERQRPRREQREEPGRQEHLQVVEPLGGPVGGVARRAEQLGRRPQRVLQRVERHLAERPAPARVEPGVVGQSRAERRYHESERHDERGDRQCGQPARVPPARLAAPAPDRRRQRQAQHHQRHVLPRGQRQRGPQQHGARAARVQRVHGEEQRRCRQRLGVELEQRRVADGRVEQVGRGQQEGRRVAAGRAPRQAVHGQGAQRQRRRLQREQRERMRRDEPERRQQEHHRRDVPAQPRHAADGLEERAVEQAALGVREDRQVEVGVEVVAILHPAQRPVDECLHGGQRQHEQAAAAGEEARGGRGRRGRRWVGRRGERRACGPGEGRGAAHGGPPAAGGAARSEGARTRAESSRAIRVPGCGIVSSK